MFEHSTVAVFGALIVTATDGGVVGILQSQSLELQH